MPFARASLGSGVHLCCVVQAACLLLRSGQAEVLPQPSRFVPGWVSAVQRVLSL